MSDRLVIYSEDELKKIQQLELDVLKEIISVCKELEIEYFLIGGTALGAARHGGFIPWDDDIDIGMTRDNYFRFIKEAPRLLQKKYSIQTPYNETKSPYPYCKVRVNGTKFVEYVNHKLNINHGVYVDIFPFDEVPNDERENEEHFKVCRKWIMRYVYRNSPGVWEKGQGLIRWCKYTAKKARSSMLHIIPLQHLMKINDRELTRYNGTGQDALACLYFPIRYKEYVRKEDLYPLKEVRFEDIMAYVPNNLDTYLQTHYGDYMELPPEEERFGHKPYVVELDGIGE